MLETYYRILKHDPEGKLVKDTGLIPSRSYVIQFLELIGAFFDSPGLLSATATDGSEDYFYDGTSDARNHGQVDPGAGVDSYGILVGTNAGESAEDNEDYALDTKIEHSGVGAAGKMNYQAVIVGAVGVVGPNVDFTISRPFLNETGSTITVKEIGIACKSPPANYHLLLRDVVTDEDVLDGYTLTVVYTIRTTV